MTYRIPPEKMIDPTKLDAWIHLNTVLGKNPSPGAAFIYLDDLMEGFKGSRLQPDDMPDGSPAEMPKLARGRYASESTSDTALNEEWMTTLPEKHRIPPTSAQ